MISISRCNILSVSERKSFSNPSLHLYTLILSAGYIWNIGFLLRVAELIVFVGLCHLALRKKLIFPKEINYLFIFLFVSSLVSYLLNMDQLSLRFLFEIFGMALYAIYAYALLTSFNSFVQIQSILVRCAIVITWSIWIDFAIASIFGYSASKILADSLFLSHSLAIGDWSDVYRPSGILYEPSETAIYLPFPAAVAILKKRYLTGIWLFSGILISSSSLAIITLLIIFGLMSLTAFSAKKIIIILVLLFGVTTFIGNTGVGSTVDERLAGTMGAINKQITGATYSAEELYSEGGSVSGFYSSYLVAVEGISSSPLFGYGISSFLQLYPVLLPKILPGAVGITTAASAAALQGNEQNQTYFVANSGLFLRLLFEIGIVGTGLILYIIFYPFFRAFMSDPSGEAAMAMLFVVAYFVACFIRKNNLLHWETWFAAILIILVFRNLRLQRNSKRFQLSASPHSTLD